MSLLDPKEETYIQDAFDKVFKELHNIINTILEYQKEVKEGVTREDKE